MSTLMLPLTDMIAANRSRCVQANIVDVAPHLASVATFAVHRNIPDATFGAWRVSNVETGCYVADGKTENDAIETAQMRLSGKTVADLRRSYAAVQGWAKR